MLHVQMEDVYDRALIEGLPPALREHVLQDEHKRFENYCELVADFARSVPDEQAVAARRAEFTEAAVWQSHIDWCALLHVGRKHAVWTAGSGAMPQQQQCP